MSRRGAFSFRRSAAIAVRVLTQIRRDRRTLGMMVAMPAVIMLIFGFALGGQVSNAPILVDNQDVGYSASVSSVNVTIHAGSQLLAGLQKDNVVSVTMGSFEAGRAGVDSGTYFASIQIPSNFSQMLFMKSKGENVTPALQVYFDGTKPSIDAGILGALQGSVQNASGGRGFNIVQQYAFGGARFSGLDVSLPSVIAFVLTFLVLLISLLTISRETTSGTLQRLYTTPLTAIERLFGYTMALLALAIMMVVVVLAVGVGLFGVVVKGSPELLFEGGYTVRACPSASGGVSVEFRQERIPSGTVGSLDRAAEHGAERNAWFRLTASLAGSSHWRTSFRSTTGTDCSRG